METEYIKCPSCKCQRHITDEFEVYKGQRRKTCLKCKENRKRYKVNCEYCDKSFPIKSKLQRHINSVHLNIRNFKCEECDYKCYDNSLLQRHIKNCTGESNLSSGEKRIETYLLHNNIKYLYNSPYIIRNETRFLRWDFIIDYNDTKYFIEFNGEHHYKPVRFGGMTLEKAKEKFIRQQEHDSIKREFCKDNNLPLLEIPYWGFDNIEELLKDFFNFF